MKCIGFVCHVTAGLLLVLAPTTGKAGTNNAAPSGIDQLIQSAYDLIKRGDADGAAALFDKAAQAAHSPRLEAKARRGWAQALRIKQNDQGAREQLDTVLELNALPAAQNFEVRLDILRIDLARGAVQEANEQLGAIRQLYLQPSSPVHTDTNHFPCIEKTQLMIAEALWNGGLAGESLEFSLPASGPGNAHAQRAAILASRALAAQGRRDDALAVLNTALGSGPTGLRDDVARIYLELIELNLRSGNPDAARGAALQGEARLNNRKSRDNFLLRASQLFRAASSDVWLSIAGKAAASPRPGARESALQMLVADAKQNQRWSDVESLSARLSRLPERNAAAIFDDQLQTFRARMAAGASTTGVLVELHARVQKLPVKQRTDALCRLADALLDAGDARGAEAACREGLRSPGNSRKAERTEKLLALSLTRQGRPDEAVHTYLAVVNRSHLRGDQNAVVRGLVDMAAALGEDNVDSLPGDLVPFIEQSIDQISSPDALLELAALLNHENGIPLALQCVDKARELLDRKVSAGLAAKQRMRLEERLVRRCYELRKDAQAVARASSIPAALTEDPSIDTEILSDFKLYWAYALNRLGRRADAEQLWNDILRRTRGDPRLFPNYAVCAGLTMLQSGDKARGLALLEEAIELNPADPTASFGRLYLAWDAMENGRIDSALQHASHARRYATPSAGKRWQRETYWTAQLLDGYLKQRAGDESGKRIVAEALEHDVLEWVADRVAQGAAQ